mmetsp:Transcript_90889/g.266107  ORF Transcript_90889/g.266107 Transcript_90889/m.266107 type:complete len:228 (-) Transcript_90889:164-847(-)
MGHGPLRRRKWSKIVTAILCGTTLRVAAAEERAAGAEADDEQPAPVPEAERSRAMLVCKHAIWKKWSGGLEEIGALVNQTLEDAKLMGNVSELALNYTEATRELAFRQLASCSREVTAADLEADKAGSLSEAAVDRLLGGPATGFNLTDEDRELFDKALRIEIVNAEAPSILGIQVHRVPWWLQILYMVGVVAAVSWVVLLVVQRLTAREKEKAKAKDEKKEGKKRS